MLGAVYHVRLSSSRYVQDRSIGVSNQLHVCANMLKSAAGYVIRTLAAVPLLLFARTETLTPEFIEAVTGGARRRQSSGLEARPSWVIANALLRIYSHYSALTGL